MERLCRRYEQGESWLGNRLNPTRYYAAVRLVEPLPQPVEREDRLIQHGWVVGFGQWYFFTAREPALAFGRAARMSWDCSGYGVYEAACEVMYCDHHRKNERVLLIGGESVDRAAGEVDDLKRFVQSVKEHPWSSHWRPPTGYLSVYNGGWPTRTRQRSLPL